MINISKQCYVYPNAQLCYIVIAKYLDWPEYSIELACLPHCSGGPPAQRYLLHQPAEGAS
jgi:hypothetical protein